VASEFTAGMRKFLTNELPATLLHDMKYKDGVGVAREEKKKKGSRFQPPALK
jgi:hypothetical protein